jgi:Mce-associated membrane protein
VKEGRDLSIADDVLAFAEQAEAEAREAEALAAAARARSIRLRGKAKLIERGQHDEAQTEASAQGGLAHGKDLERGEEVVKEGEFQTTPQRAAGDRGRRRRGAWSAMIAGLVAIVALALLTASVYMGWHHHEASQRSRRAAEFAAAAREGVVTLTSLDFNHAKEDVRRVTDNSTGTFKDNFQATTDDFIQVLESSKMVEHGVVAATAVDLTSMTNDSAEVLVDSTSEVTTATGAKHDPLRFRLVVTVTRDGDQLKMSKVESVP